MFERITGAGLLAQFLSNTDSGFRALDSNDLEAMAAAGHLNQDLAEQTILGGRTGNSKGDIMAGYSVSRERLSDILLNRSLLDRISGRTRIAGSSNSPGDVGYSVFNTGPMAKGDVEAYLSEGFVFEDFGRISANLTVGNTPEEKRQFGIYRANLLAGRPKWFTPPPDPAPPPPPTPVIPTEPQIPPPAPAPIADVQHLWDRDGTVVLSLSSSASSGTMANQKQYNIKVFDQDGTTFITNIAPNEIKNIPSFSSRINGGFSETRIDLTGSRFKFDDFGEGTRVNFMNIVEIEAVDDNNPRGRTIYKGWISQYEPYATDSGDEGVIISILHLSSLLSASYYKNGTSYTVALAADDPEDMGRAVIDHFNTIFGGALLSYTAATTDPVGTSLTKTFIDKLWFDVLKEIGEMAGTDWWWKIDEEGKYWLKAKPSTATHTFTIGTNAQVVRAVKSAEHIVNDTQVRYTGGATVEDDDATSQVTYGTGGSGKWTTIVSDTGIQDVTTATARAAKEIEDSKDAKIMAVLVINNEYDLESIKVGETCKIRNMKKDSTFFNSNMMIGQITYNGSTVSLQLSSEPSNFALALDALVNG